MDILLNKHALLQRVEIVLSDGDFQGAMEKCNTILDSDPTNGNAYFFMLLADLRCKHRAELANQESLFDGNPYYKKKCNMEIIRYKLNFWGTSLLSKKESMKSKELIRFA